MRKQHNAFYLVLSRVVFLGLAALLASCSLFGVRGDTGTVTVTLGRSSGAKALGDTYPTFYPGFPVFSSATLTVSGPDMADVSTTVALSSTTPESFTLSLDVPAGNERVVEIYAPVDWALTESFYGAEYEYPTFTKAYGGRATVSVSASGTTNVAISLEAVETQIILPDPGSDTSIELASSIAAGVNTDQSFSSPFLSSDYFGFDRYGQLLMTTSNGFYMYHAPGGTYETATLGRTSGTFFQCPFAYSKSGNCLYLADGADLYYADLLNDSYSYAVALPDSLYFSDITAVAVDSNGHVYLAGYYYDLNDEEVGLLAKLSVNAVGHTATLIASASYASLGLAVGSSTTNLSVTDMIVQGGNLYVAAREHSYSISLHHGKIVEVRLSDLDKRREIGWTSSNLPTDPSSQFYGPTRFLAIAPRKLIVSDEGYDSGRVDRVVEVDLDDWNFSETGLENAASFFETYNY